MVECLSLSNTARISPPLMDFSPPIESAGCRRATVGFFGLLPGEVADLLHVHLVPQSL